VKTENCENLLACFFAFKQDKTPKFTNSVGAEILHSLGSLLHLTRDHIQRTIEGGNILDSVS